MTTFIRTLNTAKHYSLNYSFTVFVTGGAVTDQGDGPEPVGHAAEPASDGGRGRGRQPGRAEPGVHRGGHTERHRGVHHAAHVAVGQPDRPVHDGHEPAASVVAGHRDVGRRRGRHAAAPGAHRRHRLGRRGAPPLGQGRQRVRRQLQRQRVQHGRAQNARVQPAQEGRGVRLTNRIL